MFSFFPLSLTHYIHRIASSILCYLTQSAEMTKKNITIPYKTIETHSWKRTKGRFEAKMIACCGVYGITWHSTLLLVSESKSQMLVSFCLIYIHHLKFAQHYHSFFTTRQPPNSLTIFVRFCIYLNFHLQGWEEVLKKLIAYKAV